MGLGGKLWITAYMLIGLGALLTVGLLAAILTGWAPGGMQ